MNPIDPSPARSLEQELIALQPLSRQFPNVDAALAEVARLSGELTQRLGTIHVISDVHGDNVKLRHVINNASGTLRPLVEQLFGKQLSPAELQQFLTLIFYPRESLELVDPSLQDPAQRRAFCQRTLHCLFDLVRVLARRFSIGRVVQVFPEEYSELMRELLIKPPGEGSNEYVTAVVDSLVQNERAFQLIRLTVRVARDLAIDELIIAGDFWDRGVRGDRVMEYVRRQPNVTITWGNHDAAWLGACLGSEALVAHVLRISVRYRRLSQLEEGYGITLQPLEHLVRAEYADDPADCFIPKGTGLRETIQMARMQKAAAIMQHKLEGQMIERNPHWKLEHRRLLHQIDHKAGTIQIEGKTYPLRDTHFPTIDPAKPYELSSEEKACLDRIRQSFLSSQMLWEHMRFMVGHGTMWLKRDQHLIFHACVPVDEKGEYLSFEVEGKAYRGKELFEAIERAVIRGLEKPTDKERDLLWYLWCGPRSPLFGKDKIATLENDLVADPATHVETKNPYFQMIHDPAFCDRIMREFGVDPARGLIVNGHVPVKIDKGENPLKRSGKAITIDGAFSSAYGDHGYTLVLEPERTFLAKHYHFESVEAAVRDGVDIIPSVTEIRKWDHPHRVSETERGEEIRNQIKLLQRLVAAYQGNQLRQRGLT